jgi:hypothetical protein
MDGGREVDSAAHIKFLLSEGKLQLRKLNDMLGLASPAEGLHSAGAGDSRGGCSKH